MPKLYFSSIDVGDPVAPLTKPPVTRVQIARFAGAALDYSPLHIDDDFAKSAGYGGVFAHGGIALGFATEAVQRWAENGRILATTGKFQRLVWPGDILTAKGVIVAKYERDGEPRIDVDVWAENQNHDIVMKGQVTVVLWLDDKEEKRTKGSWPPPAAKTAGKLKQERAALEAERAAAAARREAELEKAKARAKAESKAKKSKAAAAAKGKKAAAKKKAATATKKAPQKPAKKAAKKTAKKAAKKPAKKPAKKAAKKAAKKPAKKAAKKKAGKKKRR
jgi:acyl dehydratase